MFTSIDKAIVAAIMGLLFILSSAGVAIPEFINEQYVQTIVGVATPFLVWAIPNKKVP